MVNIHYIDITLSNAISISNFSFIRSEIFENEIKNNE